MYISRYDNLYFFVMSQFLNICIVFSVMLFYVTQSTIILLSDVRHVIAVVSHSI